MAKLFALESAELGATGTEFETSPEVAEASEVSVAILDDVAEVEEKSEAISEGVEAAQQLEQVEEVVETAADAGGLDPVAADAVKVAVEAICARVGANPKSIYSLYATENFQSASSRKANTRIALEGVGEFLKDLWKKIKAALEGLWDKVTKFWDKHISALGQVKKAIDSMTKKVGESSGKFKGEAYLDEAPASLSAAVGVKGDISVSRIKEMVEAHFKLLGSAEDFTKGISAVNEMASTAATDPIDLNKLDSVVKRQPKSGTLVGGVTVEYKLEVDADAGTVTLDVDTDTVDRDTNFSLVIADKNDLKDLLKKTSELINNTIKIRDKMTQMNAAMIKLFAAFGKAVEKVTDEAAKETLRKNLRIAYKINAKVPAVFTSQASFNVKMAKAVLQFASVCLKNYK